MPLTLARAGEVNVIRKVGGKPEARKFLEHLGFTNGGAVTVLADNGGNLIVNVRESRVALSRELAAKIWI